MSSQDQLANWPESCRSFVVCKAGGKSIIPLQRRFIYYFPRKSDVHVSDTRRSTCNAGWPPLDMEGNIIWNQPMSPLNVPEDGLELSEDEDDKEFLFEGEHSVGAAIL